MTRWTEEPHKNCIISYWVPVIILIISPRSVLGAMITGRSYPVWDGPGTKRRATKVAAHGVGISGPKVWFTFRNSLRNSPNENIGACGSKNVLRKDDLFFRSTEPVPSASKCFVLFEYEWAQRQERQYCHLPELLTVLILFQTTPRRAVFHLRRR